jgi:hypothetical protein
MQRLELALRRRWSWIPSLSKVSLQRNYRRRCIVRRRHNNCQRRELSVMFADVAKNFFGYRRRNLLIVHECPRARRDQIGNWMLDHRHPLSKELVLSVR